MHGCRAVALWTPKPYLVLCAQALLRRGCFFTSSNFPWTEESTAPGNSAWAALSDIFGPMLKPSPAPPAFAAAHWSVAQTASTPISAAARPVVRICVLRARPRGIPIQTLCLESLKEQPLTFGVKVIWTRPTPGTPPHSKAEQIFTCCPKTLPGASSERRRHRGRQRPLNSVLSRKYVIIYRPFAAPAANRWTCHAAGRA
jgi:hypothetical protein